MKKAATHPRDSIGDCNDSDVSFVLVALKVLILVIILIVVFRAI